MEKRGKKERIYQIERVRDGEQEMDRETEMCRPGLGNRKREGGERDKGRVEWEKEKVLTFRLGSSRFGSPIFPAYGLGRAADI
eukprot:654600-Amorphochlora_amoeboformis.AAC.1